MNGVKDTDENAVNKLQNVNTKNKNLHLTTTTTTATTTTIIVTASNLNKLKTTNITTATTKTTTTTTTSAAVNYSIQPQLIQSCSKTTIEQQQQLKENLTNIKDEKISGNGREARNRAEKNRRDKLNGSITELSAMVPHVAESQRRVDKTAVLRFSAHGLRINYIFGKSDDPCHEQIQPKCTETFLKLMESFLITITCRGQIVLVSPSIEQHLGHCQTDLFGQNIINIIHPDDHANLKRQIVPTNIESLFDLQSDEESGETKPRTQEEEDRIDKILREDKRNFTVRFARAGPRSEPTSYEIVRINGCFRRADYAPRGVKSSSLPSGLQLIRRSRGRDDGIPLHTISGNDIVLVGMGCVIKPPSVCDRLREACKYEYRTRHLIDGRIVQCDQRISVVAGYMTDEVSGLSPFTFMHKDDVRWVIVALRQMYDYSKPYGESCYRLMTRTGQFIYLRTRGYLEVDTNTNEVHTFCCINTLVDEEEGKQMCHEMKKKFSVIINPNELIPIESEISSVENPQQIERAVLNLITNLPSSVHKLEENDYDDDEQHQPNTITEIDNDDDQHDMHSYNNNDDDDDDISSIDDRDHIKNENFLNDKKYLIDEQKQQQLLQQQQHLLQQQQQQQQQSEQLDLQRKTKSPPLAIIAPKPCTIKSSITKSLNVIVAASKGAETTAAAASALSSSSSSPSSLSTSSSSSSSTSSLSSGTGTSSSSTMKLKLNENNLQQRPSVLHKIANINKNLIDDNNLLFTTTKIKTETIISNNDNNYCNNKQLLYENNIELNKISKPLINRTQLQQQLQQIQTGTTTVSSLPDYPQTNNFINNKNYPPLHHSSSTSISSETSSVNSDITNLLSPINNLYNSAAAAAININQQPITATTITTATTKIMYNNNNINNNNNNINNSKRLIANLKRTNYVDDFNKDPTKRRLIVNNEKINIFGRTELRDYDADLSHALPSSFEALDRSLHHIEGATAELRNHYNTYSVLPNSQQQLNDIIEEHQEQREILESIQHEYHTQIQNTSHSQSSTSSTYDTVTNQITEQDTVTPR